MTRESELPYPVDHPHHRWQPLRSGLVNLYRYDQEEFRFERGRMLLRGDNGTGKSRVLALQLPFLLDGETSSHRVEPDGDPSRKFEWHLLMGKYEDRVGYTWIEFGRVDENREEHYVTLGCGLKAVEGRGITDKWFFVTPQRIGKDLSLVSASGFPLSRESLDALLANAGRRSFRTAKEYRLAVDEALFQLGERRYGALVNLLIQLRKPQLSREFDEAFLSSALSEALTPLDPDVLEVIAEAYRALEDDRLQVEGYLAAHAAVSAFLSEYAVYARIASRRRAQEVRSAHSSYEQAQRDLKEADGGLHSAAERLHTSDERLERLAADRAASTERVRTLESSPEMRSARELESARSHAVSCQERLTQVARSVARAQNRENEASERRDSCSMTAEDRTRNVRDLSNAARVRASEAVFDPGIVPEGSAEAAEIRATRPQIELLLDNRKRALTELEELERELDRLEAAMESTKEAHGKAERARAEAQEQFEAGAAEHETTRLELVNRTERWLEDLKYLRVEDPRGLIEALSAWCESCSGDSPTGETARDSLSSFRQEIGQKQGALRKDAETVEERRNALLTERALLETGRHAGPEARVGVGHERRLTVPGAPLWKVIDFAPELDDAGRAGIEAALEASGMLDAWVAPQGTLISADESETILALGACVPAKDGVGIGRWLRPALDRGDSQTATLSEEMIARLLALIGTDQEAGPTWIAMDGSWHLGPLSGRHLKSAAQHIGEGARQAERRKKLTQIETALTELESESRRIVEALAELERVREKGEGELAALPSSRACSESAQNLASARQSLTEADLRLRDAERATLVKRSALDEATIRYDEVATAYQLSGWRGKLGLLRENASAFGRALSELMSGALLLEEAGKALTEAKRLHALAIEDLERVTEERRSVNEELAAAVAIRDELQAAVGAKVEEILSRLAQAKDACAGLDREIENERKAKEIAVKEHATYEERAANLRARLEQESAHRDQAITGLRAFAATGLLRTALAELELQGDGESVTAWVELARRIESALSSVDSGESAWERREKAIYSQFTQLQTALGALTYRADAVTEGGLLLVRIPFQERSLAVDEIERVFRTEVDERQRLLEARERAVIENHLVGEISTHIHDRLHEAEEWKDLVNRELDERPTSTGMKLRFDWVIDERGPATFPEARKRLMRAAVAWSEEDRRAVADFLHERLQAERAANPHRRWSENLAASFDYRIWHRFVVERQQEGRWQRLTKRTFGTGSGGEKALMLTMPQFAAAAAHYRSAGQRAPRLILLDEAFVGIDNRNRANSMGLLTTFDLDLLMTSEREWGCYPTVPGIAIYQLTARKGVDAVLATRWVWDGSRRYRPAPEQGTWPN